MFPPTHHGGRGAESAGSDRPITGGPGRQLPAGPQDPDLGAEAQRSADPAELQRFNSITPEIHLRATLHINMFNSYTHCVEYMSTIKRPPVWK